MNADRPALGIVTPLHDEEASVPELAARILAAGEATGTTFAWVPVDDASTDRTGSLLEALAADPRVRPVRLPANRGQFPATQAGLEAAGAGIVVVLDGDLQDPPEVIPRLVRALEDAGPGTGVAFAVKADRDDPWWVEAGAAALGAVVGLLGGGLPRGAGACCAMRAEVARRVAAARVGQANLSVVVGALGVRWVAVEYRKAARRHGASRVGPAGLVLEALGSLRVAVWTRLGVRGTRLTRRPDPPPPGAPPAST